MKIRKLSNKVVEKFYSQQNNENFYSPFQKHILNELVRRSKLGLMGCSCKEKKPIVGYELDGYPVCTECRKMLRQHKIVVLPYARP